MSQTITILGCGYLGSALAKQCISKGWTVSALTRNSAKAKDLRAMGVDKVIEAQIEDENWHDQLLGVA